MSNPYKVTNLGARLQSRQERIRKLEADNAKLRAVIATVEKQEAILTVRCNGCGRQVPGNPDDLLIRYCKECTRDKGASIS